MFRRVFLFILFTHLIANSSASINENRSYSKSADTTQIENFRQLMNEVQSAQQSNDFEALVSSYSKLSRFYSLNGIYEKAKYYTLKQLELLKVQDPPDSANIYLTLIDYQGILFTNKMEVDSKEIYRILNYALKTNNEQLKEEVLSLYRSFLIQNNRLEDLKDFFEEDYPEELELFKKHHYTNYLKLKALLFEANQQIDSAKYYFGLASVQIKEESNLHLIAKFYIRYGQFFERQMDYKSAIVRYRMSLEYSNQTSFIPFILEASMRLEELYFMQGDFREAYKFSHRNISLKDSLNSMANRDELLKLEIKKENELRELELEKQELSNRTKLNKEKNRSLISIILGVVLLILALGLWSRIRYVRRVNVLLKKAKLRAEQSERF
jgi:hypothetical protein